MELSYNWLREYVDLPSLEETSLGLTRAGFTVELVEERGEDFALDMDITTNRSDAMNHLGMAREAAVIFRTPLREPHPADGQSGLESANEVATVRIEAPEACARYVVRIIRGVKVGPSPSWMQERLEAIGVRPINNIVDVTNFVLWECGQPLHAFDLATLAGSEINVRMALDGELLTTLDGEERRLQSWMPVIADRDRAVALAGVMGGLDTEVTAETTDVLIESAWFEPTAVRRTAKQLGMHSDASHRFERGTDVERCLWAANRTAELMQQLGGGEILPGAVDTRASCPSLPEKISIEFDPERLQTFAGAAIPRDECRRYFLGLGCQVDDAVNPWKVSVPSWRRFDLEEEADLFEEAMRHYGFDAIEAVIPPNVGPDGEEPVAHYLRCRVRKHMAALGCAEAINYGFYSAQEDRIEGLYGGETVELANPLSDQYRYMRRSLIPGLVSNAEFNLNRGAEVVRLYEFGHVFWKEDGKTREAETLGFILGGTFGQPWDGVHHFDFFDLKGMVESLGRRLGLQFETKISCRRGFVEGQTADLYLRGSDRIVGLMAQMDHEDHTLFAAEIELTGFEYEIAVQVIDPPSRYPGIQVDLTLTHDVERPWGDLRDAIQLVRHDLLQDFGLKDRYEGEGVPAGAVNTTIFFQYGSSERSLTQDEVNEHHQKLSQELKKRFEWER